MPPPSVHPLDRLAYRMLVGDRLKHISLVAGLVFASLLVVQQASIFTGYAGRTGSWITDTGGGEGSHDLWVMDDQVEMSEDIKPLLESSTLRIRSVDGVAWAVPLFKQYLRARTPDGRLVTVRLIGIDDASLAGGPRGASREELAALRQDRAILVPRAHLDGALRIERDPATGAHRPLAIGDTISINDHELRVAGTFDAAPDFFWDPVIYTTVSRALAIAPPERRQTAFVLVRAKDGVDPKALAARIRDVTGFRVLTTDGFVDRTREYVLRQTGILINFGITIALGFVIGTLVAAQTLYSFVLENQRFFAALKAMGVPNRRIARIIAVQVLVVGLVGYGIGAGLAAASGYAFSGAGLAFEITFTTLALGLVALVTSCLVAGMLGVRRVMRLEPASVFKS